MLSSSRLHTACRRAHSCCVRRSFSFSSARWEEEDAPRIKKVSMLGSEKNPIATYAHFMKDHRVQAMKNPMHRTWVGGAVPFPNNPSFVPPEPTSDKVKTQMYNLFMADPEENNVRALSEKYFISIKRVDAILRLKGMEYAWIKGKPVQNAFQEGMEGMLAIPTEDQDVRNTSRRASIDLVQADMLEQDEKRDFARLRYQRMYWESVPEDGREPILPAVLQAGKKEARHRGRARVQHAKDLMPRMLPTPGIKQRTPAFQRVKKEGRPTVVFRDVGGKFMDVEDTTNRLKESERRRKKRVQS